MKRRAFLRTAASAAALTLIPPAARATTARRRSFEITYDIDLIADPDPAEVWLPLPQSAAGYQEAFSADWTGTVAKAAIRREVTYGARMFHAAWPRGDEPRRVRLSARVVARDRELRPGSPAGRPMLDPDATLYLKPTASMPLDGIVGETARQITRGLAAPIDKARAIYEWVVDNTFRDPAVEGCGVGDIKFMLESRNFGGKCADINSLFVGLARAAGIPAREVYGIRVADSAQFRSLGKSGDVSRAQHCRAEFYAEPWGWIPVDPADVRKVVLEENLSLADPKLRALRERLFGYWEMNWIGFNTARDFDLVPTLGRPVDFFMYPNARTASGHRDGLAPDKFRYRITARELTA